LKNQLYWLLPIVGATLGVTLILILNPRWGGEMAAIVAIPINLAAALIPLLIHLGIIKTASPGQNHNKRLKLRVAGIFTVASLIASGGIYWVIKEPDPFDFLSGTVRIGVPIEDIPGWDEAIDGKRQGFDIQLMQALQEHFHFTPDYVPVDRDGKITHLQSGDVKLVVSTFSITEGRKRKIGFAGPYFIDRQGFFTTSGRDKLEDIPPGKVCVPKGSTAQEKLTLLGWRPTPEDSLARCVQRFLDGSDPTLAVSTDAAILIPYAARKGIRAPAPIDMGLEKYGVGTPRNMPRLCKEINKVIEDFLNYQWERAFDNTLAPLSLPKESRRPIRVDECDSPGFFG
jgi:glutamate transport system substrate-binding protein